MANTWQSRVVIDTKDCVTKCELFIFYPYILILVLNKTNLVQIFSPSSQLVAYLDEKQ